jgi:hypothetical protein
LRHRALREGSASQAGSRKSLLFLKKKKQKNFCHMSDVGWESRLSPQPDAIGKKFFASFFQKRRLLLPAACLFRVPWWTDTPSNQRPVLPARR